LHLGLFFLYFSELDRFCLDDSGGRRE